MGDFGQIFVENISNSQNVNKLYIILKHVIWRFGLYNLFLEILKFHKNANNFGNFSKSAVAHILNQTMNSESLDLVLSNDM